MTQPVAVIISATIAGIVSLITAIFTVRWNVRRFKIEQQIQSENECEKKRIHFLDPLRIASQDLFNKINNILNEQMEKADFYRKSFAKIKEYSEIKNKDRNQKNDIALWYNGEGAAAVTTLYNTVAFFAFAKKIRSEIPFIQLHPKNDQLLLNFLDEVRQAYAGQFGIWIELQDSLGDYVTNQNGSVMNYKGFCSQLLDEWDYIWYLTLMDYYKNFHMKPKEEINRISNALDKLIEFIKKESAPDSK